MASTIVLFAFGLATGFTPCLQWKEIAPCTCRSEFNSTLVTVSCEKLSSYSQVVHALRSKFTTNDKIVLTIAHSQLNDLPLHTFKELNISLENLKLNYDGLSNVTLSPNSFVDMLNINYFSLADNNIGYIPEDILMKMPNIKTLDLGRIGVQNIRKGTFKSLPYLQHLVLAGNNIKTLEQNSIPNTVRKIHLGRNQISDLNGTLIPLSGMIWLFVNDNNLTSLEEQLPPSAPSLIMIHGAKNYLEKVPKEIKNYQRLQSLFLNNNKIKSMENTISKLKQLQRVQLEHNEISEISRETFSELQKLETLLLGHNRLTSINNALLPLDKVEVVNLTHNLLAEFSFEEIKGLRSLKKLDLSFNKLQNIRGPTANLIEWKTKVTELNLNHNYLETLNGALSGLTSLIKLDLSHNKVSLISPDDFIGLDQLVFLDISHNQLTTLHEMSKTFLPSLSDLIATHNQLTILDSDFHGLPVLCWADLSSNQIVALGRELVSNTRCNKGSGTLKVYLQDNPILCDAALPEIVAAMEVNFTRIHGVSHCAPLSEQPTTSKPNGYLGILPSYTPIPVRTQNDFLVNHKTLSFQNQLHDDSGQQNDDSSIINSRAISLSDMEETNQNFHKKNLIYHHLDQEHTFKKYAYSLSDYIKDHNFKFNKSDDDSANNNKLPIEERKDHSDVINSDVEELNKNVKLVRQLNQRIETPTLEIEENSSYIKTPN